MTVNTNEMLKLIYKAMDDKKAVDIKVIDIKEISTIADYFVICSGSNMPQIEAITDNVTDSLALAGYRPTNVEGHKNSSWILIDYEDIIIHIFTNEDRKFYDLERIWRDGITLDVASLK